VICLYHWSSLSDPLICKKKASSRDVGIKLKPTWTFAHLELVLLHAITGIALLSTFLRNKITPFWLWYCFARCLEITPQKIAMYLMGLWPDLWSPYEIHISSWESPSENETLLDSYGSEDVSRLSMRTTL
jgi:hypothetical protein